LRYLRREDARHAEDRSVAGIDASQRCYMATNRITASLRRRNVRLQHWPTERAWTGIDEKGWFRAPRTLPLFLCLMSSKTVSGNQDPTRVYVELLARHIDEGVVQMVTDEEHAYAAGYDGPRGVRTWRERMRTLERTGFIKVKSVGHRQFGYVLLMHPGAVVERLRQDNRVPSTWWEAYCDRQVETGAVAPEEMFIDRESQSEPEAVLHPARAISTPKNRVRPTPARVGSGSRATAGAGE
jgi:hypothetical protein